MANSAGILPGATGPGSGQPGANLLKAIWENEIRTKPNEPQVLTKVFGSPLGVNKIGWQLNIRVIPTIVAQTLAGTAQGTNAAGGTISYATPVTQIVQALPTFTYAAVELPNHLMTKLLEPDQQSTIAAYRNQLMAAGWVQVDTAGGAEVSTASYGVGAPSNIDKPLFLQAKGTLRTNAKEHAMMYDGMAGMNLIYDPSQMQYVDNIPEITQAWATGKMNSASPTVTGVVHDAWGFNANCSGNVYKNAGICYNFICTRMAFVLAWNDKLHLLDPQVYELVTRYFLQGEYAVKKVFDEDVILLKSPV